MNEFLLGLGSGVGGQQTIKDEFRGFGTHAQNPPKIYNHESVQLGFTCHVCQWTTWTDGGGVGGGRVVSESVYDAISNFSLGGYGTIRRNFDSTKMPDGVTELCKNY